jgi:hypothetical protein
MQRIAPNTVPPRQSGGGGNNSGHNDSPALVMGRRIRAEQGVERARQYLMAMEPFVAPAERAHIAQQLGIQLPMHQEPRYTEPNNEPRDTGFSQPNMPNFGNVNGMPNIPGMGNNNFMQMMQMMNAFSGMQGGKGKMDPMLMAQMLGSMMGKK